jgi:hypothetical protein
MASMLEQNDALYDALAGLLEYLPRLWGDQVIDGELELRVSADAIDDALEALDMARKRTRH